MEFPSNRASEARQAVGGAPVVKCSVGVGMWSTCKVVHHVHAAGALVHQAAQAHPLQARSCGGLGEGRRWRARWRRERSGAQPGAPAPGLVSVSTTCRTPQILPIMRARVHLAGAMPAPSPRPVTRGESTTTPLKRLTLETQCRQNAGKPFINDCISTRPHPRALPAFR